MVGFANEFITGGLVYKPYCKSCVCVARPHLWQDAELFVSRSLFLRVHLPALRGFNTTAAFDAASTCRATRLPHIAVLFPARVYFILCNIDARVNLSKQCSCDGKLHAS